MKGQCLTKVSEPAGSRATTLSRVCRVYAQQLFRPGIKVLASPPEQRKPRQEMFRGKAITHSPGSRPAAGLGGKGRTGSIEPAWGMVCVGGYPSSFSKSTAVGEELGPLQRQRLPRLEPTGLAIPIPPRPASLSQTKERTGDGQGQQ